jgi:hypothetical protein
MERIEPGDGARWSEALNHRRLIELASQQRADWVIGIDPDERFERDFRSRADEWISWAKRRGHRALATRVRELWGSPSTYRSDGHWGQKSKYILFSARGRFRFDDRPLHGSWAPYLPARKLFIRRKAHPVADLIVYHCRMIHPEDRLARWQKYMDLDPESRWSLRGYDYLIDEAGLELRPLPEGRDYAPLEP